MDKLLNKHKNDFILIGTVVILTLICIIVFVLFAKKGETVKIIVDGKTEYTYNLGDNIETVVLTGENEEFNNTVVIKKGKAYVESANCPDKICVAHNAISKEGQTIVCLPHKLVVAVE
jgi:hypothetical protein